jgi:hypothetical protein
MSSPLSRYGGNSSYSSLLRQAFAWPVVPSPGSVFLLYSYFPLLRVLEYDTFWFYLHHPVILFLPNENICCLGIPGYPVSNIGDQYLVPVWLADRKFELCTAVLVPMSRIPSPLARVPRTNQWLGTFRISNKYVIDLIMFSDCCLFVTTFSLSVHEWPRVPLTSMFGEPYGW